MTTLTKTPLGAFLFCPSSGTGLSISWCMSSHIRAVGLSATASLTNCLVRCAYFSWSRRSPVYTTHPAEVLIPNAALPEGSRLIKNGFAIEDVKTSLLIQHLAVISCPDEPISAAVIFSGLNDRKSRRCSGN